MILTPHNIRIRDELRKKTVWGQIERDLAAMIGFVTQEDYDGPWGAWRPWRDYDGSIYSPAKNAAAGITVWDEDKAAHD